MAFPRLSLSFSLLLLSLLVIASADDYSKYDSKYGFDGIPGDSPQAKPEGEEKPDYATKPVDSYKPKPIDNEKPDYVTKPKVYAPKPEGEENPYYGTKQYIYKPKPEEKSQEKVKPGYNQKPYIVKPKPEEKHYYGTKPEEKHYYGTKPDNYKAKPEEKKPYYKPKPEGKKKPYSGTKQDFYKPKLGEKENLPSVGVQGLVLCKSGYKNYPIKGALAKITCKTINEVGLEKTISICSGPTDAKGYFIATLSNYGVADKLKLEDCKAYLDSSPLETCNVPTNVNKGVDGAPLYATFRFLNEKKMNLYTVRPFFYTTKAKPAPSGY